MFNQAVIFGNVGTDPQFSTVGQNGTQLCSFTVATSRKQGEKTYTEWHSVKAWATAAKNCQDRGLKKGDVVAVCGEIKTESWEKDGTKHYKTLINVANFTGIVIQSKQYNQNQGGEAQY